VGGSSRKHAIAWLHVSTIWPIQHGVNLIQKEVSSLEVARFMFDSEHMKNPWSLFRGEPSTWSNFQVPSTFTPNVIRPTDANNWPTTHCGKKVRRLLVFKLTQQHTNNWDASKLLSPSIGLPRVNVHSLGYGRIYNILYGHKRFDVTIGNHPCCFCIYFGVMLVASLGKHGTWVQCKHVYPLQQKVSLYAKWFH
jgi:hypothetical protein